MAWHSCAEPRCLLGCEYAWPAALCLKIGVASGIAAEDETQTSLGGSDRPVSGLFAAAGPRLQTFVFFHAVSVSLWPSF